MGINPDIKLIENPDVKGTSPLKFVGERKRRRVSHAFRVVNPQTF
jgi:hypothetical protein